MRCYTGILIYFWSDSMKKKHIQCWQKPGLNLGWYCPVWPWFFLISLPWYKKYWNRNRNNFIREEIIFFLHLTAITKQNCLPNVYKQELYLKFLCFIFVLWNSLNRLTIFMISQMLLYTNDKRLLKIGHIHFHTCISVCNL